MHATLLEPGALSYVHMLVSEAEAPEKQEMIAASKQAKQALTRHFSTEWADKRPVVLRSQTLKIEGWSSRFQSSETQRQSGTLKTSAGFSPGFYIRFDPSAVELRSRRHAFLHLPHSTSMAKEVVKDCRIVQIGLEGIEAVVPVVGSEEHIVADDSAKWGSAMVRLKKRLNAIACAACCRNTEDY